MTSGGEGPVPRRSRGPSRIDQGHDGEDDMVREGLPGRADVLQSRVNRCQHPPIVAGLALLRRSQMRITVPQTLYVYYTYGNGLAGAIPLVTIAVNRCN